MGNPVAILVGSALIAAAILVVFHWEFTIAAGGVGGIYRLDRWTGHIIQCGNALPGMGSHC